MNSIKLFDIFGISIRIHNTFLILPLIFGIYYSAVSGPEIGMRAVVLILLVFLSVALHELVHSLQAKRYGIEIRDITLYPIGGIASMQGSPETPKEEFVISISGPLFNFAVALLLYYPLLHLIGKDALMHPSLESWPRTLANAFWINPILGAFNMIPAFPMDGGRVLRAILASKIGVRRATRFAVKLGQIFAVIFALIGLINRNYILIFIAIFIYSAASRERAQVERKFFLEHDRDGI
ncbi:MAG: hypothetical protein AUJ75_01040 [Candidatus Omnitrophica bacterium CG1_02_49_10]|nr:MAG: hypothetical protein AUJ75_01040 [Candidatus Omnitrophica bacterium CG1_02_49_10]